MWSSFAAKSTSIPRRVNPRDFRSWRGQGWKLLPVNSIFKLFPSPLWLLLPIHRDCRASLEFISREHFIRIFIPVLCLHWYANGGCGEWSAFYLVHYFNRSLLLLLILWIHFSSTRFTTASTLIHYISRSERILPTMLWPNTMIHPKWLNGRQSNHDMSHCCPHSTLQTTTTMWGRVCAMWELMPVTIINHITSHHRHYPNGIPVSL